MFLTLQGIISWLIRFRYFVIFPITVVEGPIVTIIAGLLVSLGYLNGIIAYFVIVIADLVGDSLHYAVGRGGRHGFAKKIIAFLGMTPERIEKVEKHFEKHPKKTLLLGKIAHGMGGIPLVAAGMAKMPYMKFLGINAAITLPKSLLLLLIGYFFGQYIYGIKHYLDYGAVLVLILAVLLILIHIFIGRLAKKSSLE